MNKNIIINDLKTYYTSEEFSKLTGFTYDNIPDNELNKFFLTHCESHKQIINVQELHEKYKDTYVLVNTPDGFQDINDLYIKGPYKIYTIKTPEFSIKCSENHLIETINGWKHANELTKNVEIHTKNGYQSIMSVTVSETPEVTYDFEVLHENHRYWGGSGISSHNTGKSYLACSSAREAQKLGYTVIYMDSEGAIDSKFVSRLGVDPTKLIIKQVSTIAETSQFIANTCEMLRKQEEEYGQHQKVFMVLDSLGNLTSDKERDDIMAGNNKRDMTKAQEIKALFRVNATPLARMGVPLVVCNHVYAAVGSYVPTNILAGGCLAPTEEVITKDGIKQIQNIVEGDYVLSHDGDYHKVLATWNFEKPTYTFEFENGEHIECSNTHRFLVNIEHPELDSSWKTADELTENDDIFIIE